MESYTYNIPDLSIEDALRYTDGPTYVMCNRSGQARLVTRFHESYDGGVRIPFREAISGTLFNLLPHELMFFSPEFGWINTEGVTGIAGAVHTSRVPSRSRIRGLVLDRAHLEMRRCDGSVMAFRGEDALAKCLTYPWYPRTAKEAMQYAADNGGVVALSSSIALLLRGSGVGAAYLGLLEAAPVALRGTRFEAGPAVVGAKTITKGLRALGGALEDR